MNVLGFIALISTIGAMVAMFVLHIDAVYKDIAKEEAGKIAEEMFEDMKRNMKVDVKQNISVECGTGYEVIEWTKMKKSG